jgi:hypothetical protein
VEKSPPEALMRTNVQQAAQIQVLKLLPFREYWMFGDRRTGRRIGVGGR